MAPETAMPITDLARLFATLRAGGLALGVATNDVTRSAVATFERLGVHRYLTAVLGYDSVERPKPAADMVLAFCAKAGIEPGEVAVVGDNLHDLVMARAAEAGLAIGVLTGNGLAEELAVHADHVIGGIDELPALLAAFNPATQAILEP
jgi:phosphoglycolate phosphatase